ncbi:hypothetical protein MERGE_001749 [Pneumocystis wakefieldiae]|uniref:Oxidation resistance protein 1 n=1 Tax=Pneumocystis wakefieldiae TaxID=38082 RepID=A0A899FZ90_9ASCO|nr:hypothetical protein MERGE_001749 [Pneumocystis wakefieldiae]
MEEQTSSSSKNKSKSFVLPPLVPISLYGYNKEKSSVYLTGELAEGIRKFIPRRLQLQEKWKLVYSLDHHGSSLLTLYLKSYQNRGVFSSRPGFVLVVKDSNNNIFGAFINEYFHPSTSYYGSRECFVWKVLSNDSFSSTDGSTFRFKVFTSTGDGKYGLWIDGSLEKGISSSTQTFNNDPLSDSVRPGERFDILGLEVWKI